MFVCGVSGQMQMGKSLTAERLVLKLNQNVIWKCAAFAYSVKKIFCDTFNVDLDFVEKWKVIPESPPGFDMPVRQSLQFIGDGFRKIKSTIWLDLAFRDKSSPIIFGDCRYLNEISRIKQEGGLNILVIRPDRLNNDPNGSEAEIRPYIDWFLAYFGTDRKFVDLTKFDYGYTDCGLEDIRKIDCFLINDSSKEEFEQLVDVELIPFVNKFVFKFPDDSGKKVEQEKCLILSA